MSSRLKTNIRVSTKPSAPTWQTKIQAQPIKTVENRQANVSPLTEQGREISHLDYGVNNISLAQSSSFKINTSLQASPISGSVSRIRHNIANNEQQLLRSPIVSQSINPQIIQAGFLNTKVKSANKWRKLKRKLVKSIGRKVKGSRRWNKFKNRFKSGVFPRGIRRRSIGDEKVSSLINPQASKAFIQTIEKQVSSNNEQQLLRSPIVSQSINPQIQAWNLKKAVKKATGGLKGAVKKARSATSRFKKHGKSFLKKAGKFIKKFFDLSSLRELLSLLRRIMSKAGSVIGKIARHPIDFIKRLFSGLGQGLSGFGNSILQYLEKGLQTFLLGPVGEMGVKLPKSFDLEGLFNIVSQLAGISYPNIRKRAADKLGEERVTLLEQGGKAVKTGNVQEFGQGQINNQREGLQEKAGPVNQIVSLFGALKEGPQGLINYFKQLDFKSLVSMVIDGVKKYVMETIVVAAITKITTYLVPGAGWIMAAVDALKVMYGLFIQRAQQVKTIVEGFTSSIVDFANGGIAQGAKLIEEALGNSIPVLISILADYLGIGGVADKVKSFIAMGKTWANDNIMPIIDQVISTIASVLPGKKG